MSVTLARGQHLSTGTNFRLFTVFYSFKQPLCHPLGNNQQTSFFPPSKQVLTLWGYGDVLALVKEILIQTACLKLNEHLVHAPHPLKVCVECSWLSFKKILLIGIKCGWMRPPAVQCFTNFLSLRNPREHIRTLSWDLHHPKDCFVI